jgi:hypothetical protein
LIARASLNHCYGTSVIGIMWVTFGHLRPPGHIMPDHAGDRGAVHSVLAPHDHLHIKHVSKVQSVVSSAWIDGRIGLRCRVIGCVGNGAATPAFPGVA